MKVKPRENIKKIVPYEPGKPIEEVQRELGLKEVIKLASNENPIGPSLRALAAIRKAASKVNRYPDGDCFYLRKRLAENFGLRPDNFVIGNGSNEIIELVIRAFLHEGEEVITSGPSFLIYDIATKVEGGVPVLIPLKNFTYDLPAMKRAVTPKTKIIFIANPNNPTGTSVGRKEVDEFLEGLPENLIVVFDEAYNEFVEREDFPNSPGYLGRGNVVILRTFSKAHGLSGLRIGFGISDSEIIDVMNRARQPFNVNSLAQVAALASLDDKKHIEWVQRIVREGKRYLYKAFDEMKLPYVKSDANFILVDVKRSGKEVFSQMLKLGVIVRDMAQYGLSNFIRVTVGTMRENKKFVAVLKSSLSS